MEKGSLAAIAQASDLLSGLFAMFPTSDFLFLIHTMSLTWTPWIDKNSVELKLEKR